MNITATLIGQMVTFAIFVLFCMKYVWPALINVMETREKRIADGLDAADRADKDLELAKKKASEELKEAKSQAANIVDQANKRANQIVEDAKAKAEDAAAQIKVAAEAELARDVSQAREKLRSQVSSLVLVGAEKVLGEALDAKAHGAILDKLAAEL